MNTGNLQRRWQKNEPAVYDKETRIVCLDIKAEKQMDESGTKVDGFSFIPVEIDSQIDYGHIKSQLIEAGFAQKDEFGLLMNAVEGILESVRNAETWDDFKQGMHSSDVTKFTDFCTFRELCADAAKEVMKEYE